MREESNLHAEATGLRPAGLTTCPTHGWGDRRVLPPLRPGSQPGSSLLGSATMVDQAGLEPAPRGVWDRCSAAELLIGAPRRTRTSNDGFVVRHDLLFTMRARTRTPFRPGGLRRVVAALCHLSYAGLAGTTGFEPATTGSTIRHSDQLSYDPMAPAQGLEPR